ncbi:ribosomal protein S5-alanine N-acetyltransferase [Vibrio agarivorans]|uniref:ribosomal protein S5-alanine N-acetyltransferase n=1 Tax=Vibrio agarivorans TaxID=153622 RepID=UPI0035A222F5
MLGEVYRAGEGFILRSANIADAQLISDYFTDNKAFLKPWEPEREAEFYTQEGWQRKLIKLQELHRLGLGFYLLIIDLETGAMMGTVSFSSVTRFPVHSCSVGYSLAEASVGRGIMTKALALAVRYMFEAQNIHRISAAYMPHNQRSAAVLQRVGFIKEGFAPEYILIDGNWQDHILTAIVNPSWKKRD